jgi:ParB family transcriptional regulator, chromosome partitioning protein
LIRQEFQVHFPFLRKRPVPASRILGLSRQTMQLEFHQLDLRWEHLRVREPHRQRQLLASLAENGQQTPVVVVVLKDIADRYLVIDGHKRIAALRQLGRDTVDATVWPMSEAEALLLSRSLRFSPQESALEQGWLLSEMEQRFGCTLDELARRFDRSVSWVSRRLALVELLPETTQRQVREGSLSAQTAMKYLVPVARVSADDCERMATAFVKHRCNARQAAQLYTAWREGSRAARERILTEPELFLKTQRQATSPKPAAIEQIGRDLEMALAILRRAGRRLPEALPEMSGAQQGQTQSCIESARRELSRMAERIGKEQEVKHAEPGATNRDSGTAREGSEQTRDLARAAGVASHRAQSPALELFECAGDPAAGESRTLPRTDPRAFELLQGQSRASP